MSRPERSKLGVTVVAVDPPFQAGHNVLFGLQDKRGNVAGVPASETTVFETEIEIVDTDANGMNPDFRGEDVHGKRNDRFMYLSWGIRHSPEPFTMFARAKIKLSDIPAELITAAAKTRTELICEVQATNAKGQPASGTIRFPDVSWRRPG